MKKLRHGEDKSFNPLLISVKVKFNPVLSNTEAHIILLHYKAKWNMVEGPGNLNQV